MKRSLRWDDEVSETVRPKFSKAKRVMASLWNRKELDELTNFCFAVNLHKYSLQYKMIIHQIVSAICPILHSIEQQWDSHIPQ